MRTVPMQPRSADDEIIDELCRRVVDREGDVTALVDAEVRHLAPLANKAEQHGYVLAALARLGGLGELDELVRDPSIDEVLVNAGNEIWIDRRGELLQVGTLTGCTLEHLIERILAPIGRRVDRSSPVVDARLADGSRVCAVVAPVAVDGATLAIRRFSSDVRPLTGFTGETGAALCAEILRRRLNVVVSGATSSGKTSLLAALINQLPESERVVVLEDTAELPIAARHLVRLEGRPASIDGPPAIVVADLVRTALRLRPDRLIVGEIRSDEVLGLMQAMNTGHDGSFATCHANSSLDTLLRLESLVMQAAPSWPLVAIRRQLARSVDVIVHVGRAGSDGRRSIVSIDEVDHDSSDTPSVRNIATAVDGDLVRRSDLERVR